MAVEYLNQGKNMAYWASLFSMLLGSAIGPHSTINLNLISLISYY